LNADATASRSLPGDGDLLARLEVRDEFALAALYDRHSAYAHAIALRILGAPDEAEEVTQDVFWRLWKGNIRYDSSRGRFSTWLYAMTRNRSLDRLRARRRQPATDPMPETPVFRAPEDPEDEAGAAQKRRRVLAALSALPDEQRRAIELCFYEGLTHREAAERLKEPLGTVKGRVKLAMDKLRVSLRGIESVS